MKLRYTPQAIGDLEAVKTYISDHLNNPEAAEKLIGKIAMDCHRLCDYPDIGLSLSEKLHRNVPEKF